VGRQITEIDQHILVLDDREQAGNRRYQSYKIERTKIQCREAEFPP